MCQNYKISYNSKLHVTKRLVARRNVEMRY